MTVRADLVRNINWRQRPLDQHAWAHGPTGKKLLTPHDLWLCWLANALGSTLLLAAPLGWFRRHGAALTGTHAASHGGLLNLALRRRSETLRIEAQHAKEVAACLHATASALPDQRKHLLDRSADGFYRRALVHSWRAELYEQQSVASRIAVLMRMIARRAYFGDPFASIGWRPLLKDFLVSLVGQSLNRRSS